MGRYRVTKSYYNNILRHAKARKTRPELEVTVDIPYLDWLLADQNNKCAYTGLPISFVNGDASLDRIDNSKGYIEGNVQWVHKDINMMKRHYSDSYFKSLCYLVSNPLPR